MARNFCKLCGARLTPGAQACPGCGGRLAPEGPQPEEPHSEAPEPSAAPKAAPPLDALAGSALQSEVHLRGGRTEPALDMAQADPAEIFHSVFGFSETAGGAQAGPAAAEQADGTKPESSESARLGETDENPSASPVAQECAKAPAAPVSADTTPAAAPEKTGTEPSADISGEPITEPSATVPKEPVNDTGINGAQGAVPEPASFGTGAAAQTVREPNLAAQQQPADLRYASSYGGPNSGAVPRYASPAPPVPPTAPLPHYALGPGVPPYPPAWGCGMPEPPEFVPTSSFLGMSLIGMIPLVGLIYLIVQAAGNRWRPNRRNFARGFLAARVIFCAAVYLMVFLLGVLAMAGGYYYY